MDDLDLLKDKSHEELTVKQMMLLPYKIFPEFDIYQNKSKTKIIRDNRLRGEMNSICENLPDMITSGNMVVDENVFELCK